MNKPKVIFTSYCQLGAKFGAGSESDQIAEALEDDFELTVSCIKNNTKKRNFNFVSPFGTFTMVPGIIDRFAFTLPRSTRYLNEMLLDKLTTRKTSPSNFDAVFSSSITPKMFSLARQHKVKTVFYAKNALNFYDVVSYESDKWDIPVRFGELDYLKRYNDILKHTDHIISLNSADKIYLDKSSFNDIKIHEVNIGVDTNRFSLLNMEPIKDKKELTFLYMGLSPLRKGLPYILETWKKYNIQHKLIVAGLQGEFLTLFKNRYDLSNVTFIGPVNPAEYFKMCDVYLSPSLAEGQPRATMEAMSAGLPVIATDVGCGGHIEHKVDGYKLESLSTESLFDAIKYIESTSVRQQFSLRAREKALSKFNGSIFGQQFNEILHLICNN